MVQTSPDGGGLFWADFARLQVGGFMCAWGDLSLGIAIILENFQGGSTHTVSALLLIVHNFDVASYT